MAFDGEGEEEKTEGNAGLGGPVTGWVGLLGAGLVGDFEEGERGAGGEGEGEREGEGGILADLGATEERIGGIVRPVERRARAWLPMVGSRWADWGVTCLEIFLFKR